MLLKCEIFAVCTLVITAIWAYTGRNYSMRTLALAMYFPSLFSAWFNENPDLWKQLLGIGQLTATISNTILAILLVIVILAAVSGINHLTGWGKQQKSKVRLSTEAGGDTLMGFMGAAGEEIGWRCYLLPQLLTHYSPQQAFLISGLVWGLFHLPIMILLTRRVPCSDPNKTVLFQFIQCVLSAVPHGWLAVQSGFSLWAPTTMHFLWNKINPVLFGSVYTQTAGRMRGKLWLINGEGVAGCLALLPLSCFLLTTL